MPVKIHGTIPFDDLDQRVLQLLLKYNVIQPNSRGYMSYCHYAGTFPSKHSCTPLVWFTSKGDLDSINLLLRGGADINAKSSEFSPLYIAINEHNPTLAK